MGTRENDKKKIKARRVENVFIDITKDMILEEGIEQVSVRKVADEAGYTVATIYNHFGSADALLSRTRDAIINDLVAYLMDNAKKLSGVASIKSVFKNYIDYCLANPNAYQFLFFHHLKDADKFSASEAVMELGRHFAGSFESIAQSIHTNVETVAKVGNTILFTVQGMLTIYLSDNFELSKEQVYRGLDDVIELIVDEKGLKE